MQNGRNRNTTKITHSTAHIVVNITDILNYRLPIIAHFMKITANLNQIRNQISQTENQFHRETGSVSLLAVSKTRTVDEIMTAYDSGQRHFGENYCQEAIEKIDTIKQTDIVWHFIGPVQSNKTSQISQYFDWVHTVDRVKIARRLDESRPENTPPLNICIQINISGESSKSGIALDETEDFIKELAQFERLKIRGLMTLPAPTESFEEQRLSFAEINKKFTELNNNGLKLDTLSIGTTNDMDAAIAEGATIVRIGTALFGPRNVKT
jgi:PLP dependent protein